MVWCVLLQPHNRIGLTNLLQYQIHYESGLYFGGKRLRELPNPIPARDEIIPDPDSVPLTVLNHPVGTQNGVPSVAYEEQAPAPLPQGGDDTM